MKVDVQCVETRFADLISAADNGELARTARPGKPALRLVTDNAPPPDARRQARVALWGAAGVSS